MYIRTIGFPAEVTVPSIDSPETYAVIRVLGANGRRLATNGADRTEISLSGPVNQLAIKTQAGTDGSAQVFRPNTSGGGGFVSPLPAVINDANAEFRVGGNAFWGDQLGYFRISIWIETAPASDSFSTLYHSGLDYSLEVHGGLQVEEYFPFNPDPEPDPCFWTDIVGAEQVCA